MNVNNEYNANNANNNRMIEMLNIYTGDATPDVIESMLYAKQALALVACGVHPFTAARFVESSITLKSLRKLN